ncbi:MAG: glycosyltransferase family A protein, partial [Fusobacterium sp.]
MITIFTPTYNRKKTLPKLYESLKNQDDKDFEWLVVDDGSSDGTDKLVEEYQKENILNIRYFYKENGGKQRAVNFGVEKSQGEYFFIVDS